MEESSERAVLTKAWYNLRLSVRCPERVPTWDAILLTAASPQQALLYQWHLDLAKRRGIIASHTVALAVPDPDGVRIGSGGATLHALHCLVHGHATSKSAHSTSSQNLKVKIENASSMSVLLVHAGGDSKRLPWANPIGKAFLALPSVIEDALNKQASSLFDHILAISSHVPQNFQNQGGLFIMTGDVLPCYDFSHLSTPDDGVCIVAVPAPPNLAANHGVVLTTPGDESFEIPCQKYKYEQVKDLLQKPSYHELLVRGALSADNTALLDSGIFSVRGRAWKNLLELAVENSVSKLLEQRKEVSLYEEIAAAWVPSRHEWLRNRPLGIELLKALSAHRLLSYCAQNLSFLHFGTTEEYLSHFVKHFGGNTSQLTLSSTLDKNVPRGESSAVVILSEISMKADVGDESLVCYCSFTNGVNVGKRCVVLGIDTGIFSREVLESSVLSIPDEHCLWQVPLLNCELKVTLCCSIHDNPKESISKRGTFCGRQWNDYFDELGIDENHVWAMDLSNDDRNLWNANLFPVASREKGLVLAMWLMGTHPRTAKLKYEWQVCKRTNFADLHASIDFQKLCGEQKVYQAKNCLQHAQSSLRNELSHGDFSHLCTGIVEGLSDGKEACKNLLSICIEGKSHALKVPQSRVYQVIVDLNHAVGDSAAASSYEKLVWEAVATETATAVGHNDVTRLMYKQPFSLFPGRNRVRVELPARIDFAGGWSDTPPWSLEQAGTVLNMAVLLEGCAPIGVDLQVKEEVGVCICDDAGHHTFIKDLALLHPPYDNSDPFRLVKAALAVTGVVSSTALQHAGLVIKTWANVPRGSGLGTSSILAAAVVKSIFQAVGADDSNELISSLVLLLEQLMGTGGGWQDQIGGLYPGVKCTTGFPGNKLRLKVEDVPISAQVQSDLEGRLVVFFTGQVRLAHNVLQNVVRRYLQRDSILISTIQRLVWLAKRGHEALRAGNLNALGKTLLDVWLLHQELDPFCSNAHVDMIFEKIRPYSVGYKLVGAGGGGFGLALTKDKDCTAQVKEILQGLAIKVYNWKISN